MKLPNAQLAIVEREKVVDYLLNPEHRYGASKARFFAEFGFAREAWAAMAAEFRAHAQAHEVARWRETGFCPRYEVEGAMTAPDGRHPRVRTVWQTDKGQIAPRLITAYPLPAL